MNILNHINVCEKASDINDGDVLVIQSKKTKKNIIVKCRKVINRGSGEEEILLSINKNRYFIWSMYIDGSSWVWRVWNLGSVEMVSITNNMQDIDDL